MKRILLTIILSLVLIVPCLAENGIPPESETPKNICPKTQRTDCKTCHVPPDNALKEKDPNASRDLPLFFDMRIIDDGKTAWLLITNIDAGRVEKFFNYVSWHPEITKCVIEINSGGGSLFGAARIVGMMDVQKQRGMLIETRCYGIAASAGFMIFVNGSKRYASEACQLMWHELITFSMFKISRPADIEDEAVVLRHIQDTMCLYLAKRSKLTKKEWKDLVFKKEFWVNGSQAIKYGLSDGYPK